MKIIIATHNKHKLQEMSRILSPMGYEVVTDTDIGIELSDVEENGETFLDNARIKAQAGCKESGLACIADDSGLCVDALGGEPGVYSARYGGEGLDDEGRVQLLLKNMKDIPDEKRTARFVCAITMVSDDGIITARGECEGRINHAPIGENGFGYDPVFYMEEYDKTTAQMTPDEKNAVSHRGKALRIFAEKLGM